MQVGREGHSIAATESEACEVLPKILPDRGAVIRVGADGGQTPEDSPIPDFSGAEDPAQPGWSIITQCSGK